MNHLGVGPGLNIGFGKPAFFRRRYLAEAEAYFERAGVTDSDGKRKTDTLFRGLINDLDVWDSCIGWVLPANMNAGTGTAIHSFGGLAESAGTLINGPTWGASGITFDGVNDYADLGDLSSHFPSFGGLVVRADVQLNSYVLFSTHANDSWWRHNDTNSGYFGPWRTPRANNYPPAPPSSGWNTWGIKSSSSAYQVWINGATSGSVAAAYNSGSGASSYLLGRRQDSPALWFSGTVSALLLFNADFDRAAVEALVNEI